MPIHVGSHHTPTYNIEQEISNEFKKEKYQKLPIIKTGIDVRTCMITSMPCLRKELLLSLAWCGIKKVLFIIFKLMITHTKWL